MTAKMCQYTFRRDQELWPCSARTSRQPIISSRILSSATSRLLPWLMQPGNEGCLPVAWHALLNCSRIQGHEHNCVKSRRIRTLYDRKLLATDIFNSITIFLQLIRNFLNCGSLEHRFGKLRSQRENLWVVHVSSGSQCICKQVREILLKLLV